MNPFKISPLFSTDSGVNTWGFPEVGRGVPPNTLHSLPKNTENETAGGFVNWVAHWSRPYDGWNGVAWTDVLRRYGRRRELPPAIPIPIVDQGMNPFDTEETAFFRAIDRLVRAGQIELRRRRHDDALYVVPGPAFIAKHRALSAHPSPGDLG